MDAVTLRNGTRPPSAAHSQAQAAQAHAKAAPPGRSWRERRLRGCHHLGMGMESTDKGACHSEHILKVSSPHSPPMAPPGREGPLGEEPATRRLTALRVTGARVVPNASGEQMLGQLPSRCSCSRSWRRWLR